MPYQTAPHSFQRINRGDEIRYVLPRRRMGKAGCAGPFLILFGLCFSGFAVFWMTGAASVGSGKAMQWHDLLFAAFGLPFVIVGCIPMLIGLALLVGRNEIVCTARDIRSIERLGPLRWKRKRYGIDVIKRFNVTRPLRSASNDSATAQKYSQLTTALLLNEVHHKNLLAWGYDRALLRDLADDLAAYFNEYIPDPLVDDPEAPSPKIEVNEIEVDEDGDARERPAAHHVPPQPTDSTCIREITEDGLSIVVPPAGLWKGSKGLFGFGVLWLLMCTGIFGGMFVMNGMPSGPGLVDRLVPVLFAIVFIGVGIAMLVYGINLGKRRAVLDVVGENLLITRQSIFGLKSDDWHRDDIKAIRVGESGMEVNDVPVMNLHVVPRSGSTFKCLTQLKDDDLDWIAAELRAALNVSSIG
jgi:hypothetical protein